MANELVRIDQALIQGKIATVRGVQVMLDRDVAELYGVPTKALNQTVKRNMERFPDRFMFQLSGWLVLNALALKGGEDWMRLIFHRWPSSRNRKIPDRKSRSAACASETQTVICRTVDDDFFIDMGGF